MLISASSSPNDDNDDNKNILDFSSFGFEGINNMYIIACINPVFRNNVPNFKYKIKPLDDNTLLSRKQMIVKELQSTYRNCKEIQFLYNVFCAHYRVNRRHVTSNDILTEGMNQRGEETISNEENKFGTLPSGETPILIILKKPVNDLTTAKDVKIIQNEITRIINNNTNDGFSLLCLNYYDNCMLCNKIKSYHKKKWKRDQKMVTTRADDGYQTSFGFGGCEDENVLIHFPSINDYYCLELMSRARKNLLIIINEEDLKLNFPFTKTMKEMINHDKQECKNETCKSKGWSKKKVVEVKYI